MPAFHPVEDDLFDGHGPERPAAARMYDYMLGGKDNFPADREAAKRAIALIPDLPELARTNRAFLTRAVTMAAEAGITQFLDLGSGMPTSPNVHETARAAGADARVVYVDIDPVVITHSSADRTAPGTGFARADLRDPAAVLDSAAVRRLLDLSRPVAVMLLAVLHFCAGDVTPIVDAYKTAVPSGSWLVISQAAMDGADPDRVGEVANVYGEGPADPRARTMREIRALFDGWELLDPPGLADVRQWAGGAAPGSGRLRMPGGIAVKPLWHITGVTEHFEVNRANWDERVPAHVASPDYAVQRFASDPAFLSDVVRFDLPLLGDISGLRGVHLQCHIGTDTVSLARLGASMTGLDFSAPAVAAARELAAGTGADATFVAGEVYAAPDILGRGGFDLVYTGIGALCWLPDIGRWARVVAALLRPGGRLFIREGHPVLWALDDERADGLLVLRYPYFERAEPLVFDQGGTYVRTDVEFQHNVTHEWNHGLGEIMTALVDAGLSITAFTEHDSVPWDALPGKMERIGGGEFRLADDPSRLPHSYTLQAVKRAEVSG